MMCEEKNTWVIQIKKSCSFSCPVSLLQDKCLRAGCRWEGMGEMDKDDLKWDTDLT